MNPSPLPRPNATTTIEPQGRRTQDPRDYLIKIVLDVTGSDADHGDKVFVANVARRALACFPVEAGATDRRRFEEIASKSGKAIVGVEASVVSHDRPADATIEALRVALLDEGFRVTVRETRECAHPDCMNDALVAWNRPTLVPPGWHASVICGRHDYKSCPLCDSVYVMTSSSSTVQAPSVRCEVCGGVMIEWGSTKLWEMELVKRGDSKLQGGT